MSRREVNIIGVSSWLVLACGSSGPAGSSPLDGGAAESISSSPDGSARGSETGSLVDSAGESAMTFPNGPFIAVSVGNNYACAILSGGSVVCWGDNTYGQLGNGTTTRSSMPVAVAGVTGATAISAGEYSACALLSRGTVQCWGDDSYGELGDGETTAPATCSSGTNTFACSPAPVRVTGLTGATAIAVGSELACALLSDGTVQCWGTNQFGELGIGTAYGPDTCGTPFGTRSCARTPIAVSGLAGVSAVAVGVGDAPCALLSDGTVQCWGPRLGGPEMTPVAVGGLTEVTAISVGGGSTCAVMSVGTVQCWGNEWDGDLGNGTKDSMSSTPAMVASLTTATAVSLGFDSACALLSGGGVRCWGDNSYGELGTGASTGPDGCGVQCWPDPCPDAGNPCSTTPVAVTGLTGATGISVGSLGTSVCALRAGGTVQCWGRTDLGQLGNGNTTGPDTCTSAFHCSTTPVTVESPDGAAASSSSSGSGSSSTGSGSGSSSAAGPDGGDATGDLTGATAVSVGQTSGCAVLSGGGVQCWGDNGAGQLGNGTTISATTPVDVSGLTDATAVSVGAFSACALRSGGGVQCWGRNTYGQLGNGTTTRATTPVGVSGLQDATAISVGAFSACALLSGGTVQCWGDNSQGELGNGTQNTSSTPVAVTGLTRAIAVSVGRRSACALLSDGTVQCWGDNTGGDLGTGASTGPDSCRVECSLVPCPDAGNPCATTPVVVTGLTGVTAISVGVNSACALLPGGSVQCWGENTQGELGDGTTTRSSTPVAVTGLTGATAISVGWQSACALLSGGGVQCWGDNSTGELGDGTSSGPDTGYSGLPCSKTPVPVSTLTGATGVSVGGGSVCAVMSGGAVQCWGYNADGELGNGTTITSTTPVVVQ